MKHTAIAKQMLGISAQSFLGILPEKQCMHYQTASFKSDEPLGCCEKHQHHPGSQRFSTGCESDSQS